MPFCRVLRRHILRYVFWYKKILCHTKTLVCILIRKSGFSNSMDPDPDSAQILDPDPKHCNIQYKPCNERVQCLYYLNFYRFYVKLTTYKPTFKTYGITLSTWEPYVPNFFLLNQIQMSTRPRCLTINQVLVLLWRLAVRELICR